MKKIFLVSFITVVSILSSQAQGLDFGIKGGANFANLKGGSTDGSSITSFHLGLVAELNVLPNFSIQPEVLYSSQGAKFGSVDKKVGYLAVPVLAKYFVLPSLLSFEVGPQFSFKTNENLKETYEAKSFDFALAGGASVSLLGKAFVSARYVVGMTEFSKDAKSKNHVIQLSVGYKF